jgi:D-xylose transport system substrate-binding protein
MQKAILGAGVSFKETNAKSSIDTQRSDIDELVVSGAKVIIIEPGPEDVILPAVQRAIKAGIPVVTLDRSIDHARTLHVAFDPIEEGRQEARALLAVKPKGDYVIIKGDSTTSPESDLKASGILEILQPAVDRGDIKIVASLETPLWDGGVAQQEMTTILRQNGRGVDAVAVESDGMAFGVEQALREANLTGKVAVAGVSTGNGNAVSGLMGVISGTQAVDVWGNPERVGMAIGQAAIALCRDPDITRVEGSASVTWPGRDPMTAILLKPVTITKDNISDVIYTSIKWRQQLCGDVTTALPTNAPAACQVGPVPLASPSAQSQP